MTAFDIIRFVLNPVLICTVFIPILVHFSYRFLKTRDVAETEDLWLREIIEKKYFEVVLFHAIHLILFWAGYVIFIIQYLKVFHHFGQKYASISLTINHMYSGFISGAINLIILIFVVSVVILTLKSSFAKDKILEGYKQRFEDGKWYPPINILSAYRFLLVILTVGLNIWEKYYLHK